MKSKELKAVAKKIVKVQEHHIKNQAEDQLGAYVAYLVTWLKEQAQAAKKGSLVVGVSGGVDSALVAALATKAVGPKHVIAVNVSIGSNPLDLKLARKVAAALGIELHELELKEAFASWHKSVKALCPNAKDRGVAGNAKARFRMTSLYAFAQANGALVLGTDNADEMYTGYFTKYGDGGVDVLPIVNLTKDQVRKAARFLGIPPEVVDRAPSASLWPGQTDEQEMGFAYDQLDAYLLNYPVSEAVRKAIERLHAATEHKRAPLPRPKPLSKLREG